MVDSVQNSGIQGRPVPGIKPANPAEKTGKADGTAQTVRTNNIKGVNLDIQTDEEALQLAHNVRQQLDDDRQIALGDKGRILDDII